MMTQNPGSFDDSFAAPSWSFKDQGRGRIVVGVLIGVVIIIALQYSYWYFTVDDAFITFRYADNLARGHGIAFNPGERVEGYTNFLWMIILSLVKMAGLSTVMGAKFIGAACGIALIPLTSMIVVRCSGRAAAAPAILGALLLAATPSVAVWSVAGLETSLFTLLIVTGVYSFLGESRSRHGFPISAFLFALATLTRPDGALFFLVSGIFVVRDHRRKLISTRSTVLWFLVFLSIVATYSVWRWGYFGYAFPNTFYAKTGRGIYQWLGGLLYTTAGIRKHGGMLFFAFAFIPAFWGTCKRREARYLASLVFAWLIYNVYKGHDVLSMFRFFVPMLPLLFALVSLALFDVLAAMRASGLHRAAAALFAAVFLLGTFGTNVILAYLSQDLRPQIREYQLQLRMDARWFEPTIKRLQEIAPESSSIALVDAGAIAYYTGWYVIDRWGLCDEHIAHSVGRGPLGEKFDADYVLSKEPTFIQTKVTPEMEKSGDFRGAWAGDAALFAHPRFHRDYVRVDDTLLKDYFVRKGVALRTAVPQETR